ncbi:chemotaxis protein CheR [Skermanella stibiiresistens SB22]|uniref:Chemotaxis protein methyltransferase n=1 Tax=Skermanella stibiiresistens SB22 TaxID=1385369 RepID=W9H190_9PROT|nr:protein-glutamate O-methyltransferase [Skermanella stibiiresistens]EWY39824.1 chemotaxis protein CheR [Skermanella stibiiresistens SB22]
MTEVGKRSAPAGRGRERTLSRSTGEREFHFTRTHFDQIAALLQRLTGIHLATHKVEMVYSRLARRLRDLGMADFDAYCAFLSSEAGTSEISLLVNALTTNLTRFYREPHHFEHLAAEVLPQIQRRRAGEGKPRLRIWSAGCSSGEEPYTIAMTVATTLPDITRWDARILATDIDTHMVDTARRGIYPADAASAIPPSIKAKHTTEQRQGSRSMLVMGDSLRRMITFKPLNLLEEWPMRGPFDVIFCRNVLIYFDRYGRSEVIGKFHQLLGEDGHLYLGHSESLYGVSDQFRQVGPTSYQVAP